MHRGPAWEFLSETPRHRHIRLLSTAMAAAVALILVMAVILGG